MGKALDDRFINRIQLDQLLEKVTSVINQSEQQVLRFKKDIEESTRQSDAKIEHICSKKVQEKLMHYDAVAKSFRKFFNDDCLYQQIQSKAEKKYVDEVSATKSTC